MINELCMWTEEDEILTISKLLHKSKLTRLTLRNRIQELKKNDLITIIEGKPRRILLTTKGKEARIIAIKWKNLVNL